PTKRLATGLATGVLVIALILRTIAAMSSGGFDWLRWGTPFGWGEEMRPCANPQPLVLLFPGSSATLLLVVAGALLVRRDLGRGLLPARESAATRLHPLVS